ncbi:hypothetical protein GCM10023189_45130 [Nibrella saemangeumensis]|uniref:PepSY-associated TM region n=1 Tax=Nibrella saemangeumensis TaxID=1084526 RepID=A0ABP8NGG5_9BACT
MTITLSSYLAISAEVAFDRVKRPALLHYIGYPLIHFVPSTPFPSVWQEGEYETQMNLLGLIPLGRQLIRIELPTPATDGSFRVRDNGQGQLARTWDHWITINPVDTNRCRYTDQVSVQAGLLTPLVWLFALGFYSWRQYRWKRLVRLNFQPITYS